MTELLKDKKKLSVNIALTLCYAIFTFFIVLHHELWIDEVQVWQIVKNLNVLELFSHLRNEGHPSFFYLLIMPFAKLNFSIFSMKIICHLFCTAGVFLFLQFSPFKWWCKLSIILSAGFLYVFPVIARSYSLIPFFIFLLAAIYSQKQKMPLLYSCIIFIISQLHVIMFALSGLLALLFWYEIKQNNTFTKKNVTAISIMCTGLLLVILQLYSTIGSNTCFSFDFLSNPLLILNVFVEFFANTINDVSKLIIPILVFICGAVFLYIIFSLFKISKKAFWIVFLSIAFQFLIYITVYARYIYITRIFCAYLIIIFGYWIALEGNADRKAEIKSNILLTIYFSLSIYNGVLNCINDIKAPYSGSKPMAEFIKGNINNENSVILYQNPNIMIPLIYYLPNYDMIYSPYCEKVKFVVWDKRIDKLMPTSSWSKFLTRFQNENSEKIRNKDIYILQVKDFYTPVENTEIIFVSEGYKATFENYVLMKLKKYE